MTLATVKEAATTLETKLKELGRPVLRDPGQRVDPPALILGPPGLGWSGYCGPAPTTARFSVWIVVPADGHALERLWELVPQVAAKVEELVDATLADVERAAQPATFPSGGVELPAYEVQVDYAL